VIDPEEQQLRQAHGAQRALTAKGDLFTSSHLWTPDFLQRAKRWIENFPTEEKPLATALLDGFLYFSDQHATQLTVAGFHALSPRIARPDSRGAEVREAWTGFYDRVVIANVEGERRNITDSGLEAARKFRKATGFPEGRILSADSALKALISGAIDDVVFLDDFAGTGAQFRQTWTRPRPAAGGEPSFHSIFAQIPEARAFYCPSVCTVRGMSNIQKACPGVIVSPGALLSDRHDVLHPESIVWSADKRVEGQAFVTEVSARLGLPDTDGDQTDWRGFDKLGLALGLRDSIPDATLGLFRHEHPGWSALIRDR